MHRVNWHGSGPGLSGWGERGKMQGVSIAWTRLKGKLRSGNRAGWQNRKNAPSEGITNGIAQEWPILEAGTVGGGATLVLDYSRIVLGRVYAD